MGYAARKIDGSTPAVVRNDRHRRAGKRTPWFAMGTKGWPGFFEGVTEALGAGKAPGLSKRDDQFSPPWNLGDRQRGRNLMIDLVMWGSK
jgi:hypothetical protein